MKKLPDYNTHGLYSECLFTLQSAYYCFIQARKGVYYSENKSLGLELSFRDEEAPGL